MKSLGPAMYVTIEWGGSTATSVAQLGELEHGLHVEATPQVSTGRVRRE